MRKGRDSLTWMSLPTNERHARHFWHPKLTVSALWPLRSGGSVIMSSRWKVNRWWSEQMFRRKAFSILYDTERLFDFSSVQERLPLEGMKLLLGILLSQGTQETKFMFSPKTWTLRARQISRILSYAHLVHCVAWGQSWYFVKYVWNVPLAIGLIH